MAGVRALLVVLAFVPAGCGSVSTVAVHGSASPGASAAPSASKQPTRSIQPTPSAEPSPSVSPSPPPITNSPIPTANGWVTYINHKGQLTLSAPAAWRVISCEADIGYLVAVTDPPVGCGGSEYYSAWLFGVSLEGDQRQSVPPAGGSYISIAPITGSQDVILNGGVHGIRYTATETRDGMIGTPRGTTEVYYLAYNGVRTYAIGYYRLPGAPDRSADFDRMIKETLRFGA